MRLPLSEILLGLDIFHRQDALRSVEPDGRVACTAGGKSLPYDGLFLALGGTPFAAFSHGISFDRPDDPEPFMTLLEDVEAGLASSVAFVVPEASSWALPAYDLALLLARLGPAREAHGGHQHRYLRGQCP